MKKDQQAIVTIATLLDEASNLVERASRLAADAHDDIQFEHYPEGWPTLDEVPGLLREVEVVLYAFNPDDCISLGVGRRV